MKQDFVQPRFTGERFEEHTLPLEVVRDLIAYQDLIVELAKNLYLDAHPQRKRVPRGFESEYDLHLERVDEGSSKPLISLVAAGTLAVGGPSESREYLERARDVVAECVASAEGTLPQAFPERLLKYFNQIGRSLRDDEGVELGYFNKEAAALNQERRKTLVLAANARYEKEFKILGTIEEAKFSSSTLGLKLIEGGTQTVSYEEDFDPLVRLHGGNERTLVTVEGIAQFDKWNCLKDIIKVEKIEVQENCQILTRLEELSCLEDGWYNGLGAALKKEGITTTIELLVSSFPKDLPLPGIFPTPEGDLSLEWNHAYQSSLDIDLETLQGEFHAVTETEEIEEDFDLSSESGWRDFYIKFSKLVG